MPVLDNPRHERFAQLRASGKTGSDSYRGIAGATAKNPDVQSDKLQRNPEIAARIEELKVEAAKRCSLTREAFVESLVEMYRGKPGEAALDNPLCDSLITRGQRFAVFPPKATIASQPAKLCGWMHRPSLKSRPASTWRLSWAVFSRLAEHSAATVRITAMASAPSKQAIPQQP